MRRAMPRGADPRGRRSGAAWACSPKALADNWTGRDPEGAANALGHIGKTANPADQPVLSKLAKEQWQNRLEFFYRPIVPGGCFRSSVGPLATCSRAPTTCCTRSGSPRIQRGDRGGAEDAGDEAERALVT